jgi:hypothetical protein
MEEKEEESGEAGEGWRYGSGYDDGYDDGYV